MSDGEKVQLPCPKCGQRISAPANRGGSRAKCPNCQNVFTLPGPRTEAPSPRKYDGIPPFPIIRIDRTPLWHEVVAIYEKHLVCGKRFLIPPAITEEMCQPTGEAALKKLLFRPKTVFFSDITELREEGVIVPPASGSRANAFTVVTAKKLRLNFAIQASQVKTPRAFLGKVLGDRYSLTKGPYFSRYLQVRFFLTLGGLFGLFGVMAFYERYLPLALMGLAPGALLCGLGLWRQFGKPPEKKALGKYASTDLSPLKSKPKTATPKRAPFRSAALGWVLKLLGVGYITVLASRQVMGLGPVIYTRFPHANVIIYSIWILVWLPAPLLILAGFRLCPRSRDRFNSSDTRKPILILRPFENDAAISLQPAGLLAWLLGIRSQWLSPAEAAAGKKRWRFPLWDLLMLNHPVKLVRMLLNFRVKTAEESLVNYFRKLGPVMAIGQSSDPAAPAKARKFSDYAEWQNAVHSQIGLAQAVVVQPGSPSGVRWELEQVRASVDPARVLLCPAADWRNPHAYEELSMFVRNILDADLPRAVPYLPRPVFIVFKENWKPRLQELSYKYPLWWPLASDATNLKRSLRAFVKGWQGQKVASTRRTRWSRKALVWAGDGAAFLLAVALIYLPFGAADSVGEDIIDPSLSTTAANDFHFDDDKAAGPLVPVAADPEIQAVANKAGKQLVGENKTRLAGTAVHYEFTIPNTMVEVPPESSLMEFSRESPDGRMRLQVIATTGKEDLSSLPDVRVAKNGVLGKSEAKLESSQTVKEGGLSWIEARIIAKSDDSTVREIARGTSGDYGTIIVILSLNNSAEADSTYLAAADEILNSFHLTR